MKNALNFLKVSMIGLMLMQGVVHASGLSPEERRAQRSAERMAQIAQYRASMRAQRQASIPAQDEGPAIAPYRASARGGISQASVLAGRLAQQVLNEQDTWDVIQEKLSLSDAQMVDLSRQVLSAITRESAQTMDQAWRIALIAIDESLGLGLGVRDFDEDIFEGIRNAEPEVILELISSARPDFEARLQRRVEQQGRAPVRSGRALAPRRIESSAIASFASVPRASRAGVAQSERSLYARPSSALPARAQQRFPVPLRAAQRPFAAAAQEEQKEQAEPAQEEEADLCSICMETLNVANKPIKKLNCNHAFHQRCVDQWISAQVASGDAPTCPLCRREVIPQRPVEPQGAQAAALQLPQRPGREFSREPGRGFSLSTILYAQLVMQDELWQDLRNVFNVNQAQWDALEIYQNIIAELPKTQEEAWLFALTAFDEGLGLNLNIRALPLDFFKGLANGQEQTEEFLVRLLSVRPDVDLQIPDMQFTRRRMIVDMRNQRAAEEAERNQEHERAQQVRRAAGRPQAHITHFGPSGMEGKPNRANINFYEELSPERAQAFIRFMEQSPMNSIDYYDIQHTRPSWIKYHNRNGTTYDTIFVYTSLSRQQFQSLLDQFNRGQQR